MLRDTIDPAAAAFIIAEILWSSRKHSLIIMGALARDPAVQIAISGFSVGCADVVFPVGRDGALHIVDVDAISPDAPRHAVRICLETTGGIVELVPDESDRRTFGFGPVGVFAYDQAVGGGRSVERDEGVSELEGRREFVPSGQQLAKIFKRDGTEVSEVKTCRI